jgi:Tol biopolymer transport system component
MSRHKVTGGAFLFVACFSLGLQSQALSDAAMQAVGINIGDFMSHGDVGIVKTPGNVGYDDETQIYQVSGSGTNMWSGEDQFQFVWRKMSGNFILSADTEFLGQGVDPHRKMGWMIRASLDTDSPYVDVARHGDGLTTMQFRRSKGADTEQVLSTIDAPEVVQLERKEGKYIMSVARKGATLSTAEIADVVLPDEVYVGLFICAHNADVVETGRFSNVRITIPAPDDFQPYRDYFGSRLEILDIDTGQRRVVHTEMDSLQAPNWTRDGLALIYNRNGRLYRFDLRSREITEINSAFATSNNNDHVISFNGEQLGISHHSADHNGESMIYTMPVAGGVPKLVTQKGPSYFHGWSPDGEWLVYTGGREGKWDIYKIRSDGSAEEVRLTEHDALDDGSEFSPDGNYIYFNSSRTGKMQIWRMKTDGSDQEQVTDDDYNNWFPHVSPDGKQMVYLAYMPEVRADDHPWYKHVYLMIKPIDGGDAKVIANLYGGQGTINVPSWSPDSKRIAFVSNSVL